MKRILALCLCGILLLPALALAKIEFPDEVEEILGILEKYLTAKRLGTVDADMMGDVTLNGVDFDTDDHYAILTPDDEDPSVYNALFNYGGTMAVWADMTSEDALLFIAGMATAYDLLNDSFSGDNFKFFIQLDEDSDGVIIYSSEQAQQLLDIFDEEAA